MVKGDRWVGVDIGSGHVKAVVVRGRGHRLHVVGHGSAQAPNGTVEPDAAAMARAIRQAVDAAGAHGANVAMCALPRQAVAVRTAELPGAPSEQLARAAALEATRDLPFGTARAVVGVALRAAGERTRACLAAVREESVAAYRAAMEAAGLRVANLGVSSVAAAALADGQADGPWLLVDIGAHATSLEMVDGGLPRMGRVLHLGGEDLTHALASDLRCDAESAEERKRASGLDGVAGHGPIGPETKAWLTQLVSAIRLHLAAWGERGDAEPRGVRLAGGGGALKGLAPWLQKELGLKVEAVQPELLREPGVENAPQYAAALAMALAGAGQLQTVDLLEAETRRQRAASRRRRRAWMVGAVCLVAVVWAGVFAHGAWKASQRVAVERARVARSTSEAQRTVQRLRDRRRALTSQLAALRSALRPQHAFTEVLDELAALAPAGIWLTGIELERGKPLVVRGTGLRPEQAADFAAALMGSPLFEQARLSFAHEAELDRLRVTQFGITALVRGSAPDPRPEGPTRRRTTSRAGGEEEGL